MRSKLPTLSFIGAGAVGSALAFALHEAGYPVASVISRTGKKAIRLARAVGCTKASTAIEDIHPSSEILFLTVTDDAIAGVAAKVAASRRPNFRKILAVHCSGVYPASLLRPLARKGASVVSIHPIQTFPSGHSPASLRSRLRGTYFGVDGEPRAVDRAIPLVEAVRGIPLVIRKELKPLYHVTCVFASNYLTVLLNAVAELSAGLGLKSPWPEVFGPLMAASMEHAVKGPPGAALTGPVVRGDLATIELHLKALARHAPQLLPLYTIAGIDAARIARDRGGLSSDTFTALVRQVRKFITSKEFP